MTDTPQHPLTDQALTRLRRLAEGNGLTAQDITLVETQEQIYTLEATLTLTPLFETQNGQYPGSVRGKGRQVVGSPNELKQEIDKRKKEFTEGSDWIPAVITELKTAQGSGWGYHDATISLADKSVVLATTTACLQCQGRRLLPCQYCQSSGRIQCPQCLGRRQETCFTCGGNGENPAQPGQPCTICHGAHLINCRTCLAQGQIACTRCQGRGGTACPTCNGSGEMTDEVAITCGARTSFKLESQGLPSGLRRGLDRLEFVNLSKGHADIEMMEVAVDDADKDAAPTEGRKPAALAPMVNYRATLPYADAKIRFGDYRPSLVTIFGKRGLMMGVPFFLDEALEPWRAKLRQAAAGQGAVEPAIEARAIRDAMGLEIASKGSVRDLRKIYNLGLSSKVAQEILTQSRLTLNRLTWHLRAVIAAIGLLLSIGLFGVWFILGLRSELTRSLSHSISGICDGMILALALIFSWLSLSAAIRFMLQKRFPQFQIPLQQKMGKTGYAMMISISMAFILLALTAPTPPAWLAFRHP